MPDAFIKEKQIAVTIGYKLEETLDRLVALWCGVSLPWQPNRGMLVFTPENGAYFLGLTWKALWLSHRSEKTTSELQLDTGWRAFSSTATLTYFRWERWKQMVRTDSGIGELGSRHKLAALSLWAPVSSPTQCISAMSCAFRDRKWECQAWLLVKNQSGSAHVVSGPYIFFLTEEIVV